MIGGTNPLASSFYEFQTGKHDIEAAKKLAESFCNELHASKTQFFYKRNEKIKRNRLFARGRQPMNEYLDLMGIDGKQSFVNLNLKPPPIAPKFMEVLVGRFMERDERVTVEAVDYLSKNKKKEKKKAAKYRMDNQALIQMLSELGNYPVEDPNEYVPESKEDFELWADTELRLDEELKFQKYVRDILNDNNYTSFKRRVLDDLAETGFMVGRVYRDSNGKIIIRNCIPENCYFTYSEYDDFHDVVLVGEKIKMRVCDFRKEYGNVDEEELFKLYSSTDQTNRPYLTWQEQWRNAMYRPYDDAVIDVFTFEIRTVEKKSWYSKKDKRGRTITTENKDSLSGNIEEISKDIQVVYAGAYASSTGKMLAWKKSQLQLRPMNALHEVLLSYCVYMPQNREMDNMAPIEKMETAITQMTIAHLKIQHLISTMKPDGLAIDITGLGDIDLGQGPIKPLQVMSIYNQKGDIFYKGIDDSGEMRKSPPIMPLENNTVVTKLQSLTSIYNFYLQQLRDFVGTNEYVEGQGVNPKTGLGVLNSQVSASNRATAYLYESYISFLEGIAKRIAILAWDDIVLSGKEVEELTSQDLEDMYFDINISMMPTEEDQQYIETLVNQAIGAKIVNFEEAFKVRRLAKEDTKLAERYLALYQKRREKTEMEKSLQLQQANAQTQVQSLQAKQQGDLQLKQVDGQMKIAVQQETNKGEMDKVVSTLAQQLIISQVQNGAAIPEEYKPLIQLFLQNALGKQAMEAHQQQMEAAAMAQQMNQQQQGQGQEQEGQAEDQQEGGQEEGQQ